ncbi:cell wall-active antibiotics response protein LiaF [Lentibacillus sp. N15]|uniref:cell wall-active antibiotics response protein LiaF n=1 Tax=Lentibacillus songyuanensis TaxID=3136161 RepID=UPI0031B9FA0B
MFNRLSTDTWNWILLIGAILFAVEITFFHGGTIISALISGFLIYFGKKRFHKLHGKIIFWIGVVGLAFSAISMLAVRFFIVVVIILFALEYYRTQKEPYVIQPNIAEQQEVHTEAIIEQKPLFTHRIFGNQETDDTAYQWRDINIHSGIGNRIIDLSNTVLPNDTVIVSIRHIAGNIEIFVPYDVEISLHHSAVFGRADIFNKRHLKLMNDTIFYQTQHYDDTVPRIKIITSVMSGNIEVRRI